MSIGKRALFIVPLALFVVALVGLPLVRSQGAQSQPGRFEVVEATIADVHRAIQQGQITLPGTGPGVHRSRQGLQRRQRSSRHRGRRADSATSGTVRAGAPLKFPTETVAVVDAPAEFRSVRRAAHRAWPHGGDRVRSGRAAAVRHDRRHAELGSDQRTRHAQSSRRAVGHVQGRSRQASVVRSACPPERPPSARSSASSPMRSSARQSSMQQYGALPDLAKLPMYCIPFSFKDPFDTMDMRTTAAADARYDIDFPARDHTLVAQLRQKGAIIYAKAVNTEYNGIPGDPGGTATSPKRSWCRTSAISAAAGRGNPAQRVRHDARSLARLELGLRRVGEREPRDVQHLRGDEHVVPRAGQSQLGGADPAAQGAWSRSSAARSAPTSTTTVPASTAAASRTPRRCSTR